MSGEKISLVHRLQYRAHHTTGMVILGLLPVLLLAVIITGLSAAEHSAERVAKLSFGTLRTAMERGWNREQLETLLHALNEVDASIHIDLVRGPLIIEQFGERPLRKTTDFEGHEEVLSSGQLNSHINWSQHAFHVAQPVHFEASCLACHQHAVVGAVAGALWISLPLSSLQIPLLSLFPMLVLVLLMTLALAYRLFSHEIRKEVIQPLYRLSRQLRQIDSSKGYWRGVDIGSEVAEMRQIEQAFNQQATVIQHHLEQLRELAVTDPLTGLFNRQRLQADIDEEITRYQRFHHPFALVLVDLNDFKPINDRFGHEAGDSMLRHFAQLLRRSVRRTDRLYRLGGDEFLLLLVETDQEGAVHVVQELQQQMTLHPVWIAQQCIPLNAACGVALCPEDGEEMALLLACADTRMYDHKREQKQSVAADCSLA